MYKIRIKGKGLTKAQYQNSQVGGLGNNPFAIVNPFQQSGFNPLQQPQQNTGPQYAKNIYLNDQQPPADWTPLTQGNVLQGAPQPGAWATTSFPSNTSIDGTTPQTPSNETLYGKPLPASEKQWEGWEDVTFDPNFNKKPSRGKKFLYDVTHPRQTVMRNLYNMQQNNKSGIPLGMKIGNTLQAAATIGSAAVDFFDNRKKQKEWDKWFRQQSLPDNMYAVSAGDDRGDFDINEGVYRPNQLTPPNPGAFYGAKYGGTQDNESDMFKIRIKSSPDIMAYGGQQRKGMSLGLDLGQRNVYRDMPKEKSEHVRASIPEVPRDQANIEAEKGETVYGDLDGDGALEHLKIEGKRHTEGGTPLNVPDGSFIFSDTKKMTIKDPVVLERFGMKPRKEGYTPAEIAKKYDINKYKGIMEDPNIDPVRKSTAQLMIKNFQKKLAELALIQEGMKGFPQGVPAVARQTLPEAEQLAQSMEQEQTMEEGPSVEQQEGMASPMGQPAYPEDQQMMEQEQAAAMEQGSEAGMEEMEQPEMGYGGMPMYQGVTGSSTVTPYKGGIYKTPTPTGKSNIFNRGPEYLQSWEQYIPGISNMTNAQAQSAIYDYTLAADPERAKSMWKEYGLTTLGRKNKNLVAMTDIDPKTGKRKYTFQNRDLTGQDLQALKGAYVDALFGARQLEPFAAPETPTDPGAVIGYSCIDGVVQSSSYKDEAARNAAGAKATQAEAAIGCTPGEKPNKMSVTRTGIDRHRWMTPDKVNLLAAAAVPPKKYLPWEAKANYEPNRLSLEDYRAQLAAEQSMYNKQGETMGVYGPTTGQAANQSFAAGQQAERAGNVISGVTSRNVDRVNQFLAQERARKDQYNLLGTERATRLFDKNVTANQQYDNSKRAYINNLAKTFGQGWGNAMKLGMVNAVNPRYKVDPISGASYYTGRGLGVNRLGTPTSSRPTYDDFASIKTKNLQRGMSEQAAENEALRQIRGTSSGSSSSNVDPMDLMQYYNFNFQPPFQVG